MARLDYFAVKLQDTTESLGYVLVHPEIKGLRGKYQSYLEFAREYLVNTRGISSQQLITLVGKPADRLTTELWLVSKSVTFPMATAAIEKEITDAEKFDEGFADYSSYQGKLQLWTYDMCGLGAVNLKAFAEYLQKSPSSKGRIIIHLEGRQGPNRNVRMAKLLRDEMRNGGIDDRRVSIVSGRRTKIPSIELWIIPRRALSATSGNQ
jgi:hypothetical protein